MTKQKLRKKQTLNYFPFFFSSFFFVLLSAIEEMGASV